MALEIELYPRGTVWAFFFYTPEGKRRRLSTGLEIATTTEEIAMAEARRRARVELGNSFVEERASGKMVPTLAAALQQEWDDRWHKMKSSKELGYVIRQMQTEPICYLPITEVNTKVLKDYVRTCEARNLKPATINRKLTCISTALASREEEGELPAVPTIPYLPEDNVKDRYVTPEEEAEAMKFMAKRQVDAEAEDRPRWIVMSALYVVLVDTGIRLGEACGLTEFNVRRAPESPRFADAIWLKHGTTKNNKGRVIPLTERATEALRVWLQRYELLPGTNLNQNWCIRRWAKVRKAIPSLADVNLHILRHTCASRLLEAGIGIFEVSKWLGHKDLKSTERYVHLVKDMLVHGARALDRWAQRQLHQQPEPQPEAWVAALIRRLQSGWTSPELEALKALLREAA